MYSVPATALAVLSRPYCLKWGADVDDLRQSGVYYAGETIEALRRQGYHIQSRMTLTANNLKEPRYFIDPRQVTDNALKRKGIEVPVHASQTT